MTRWGSTKHFCTSTNSRRTRTAGSTSRLRASPTPRPSTPPLLTKVIVISDATRGFDLPTQVMRTEARNLGHNLGCLSEAVPHVVPRRARPRPGTHTLRAAPWACDHSRRAPHTLRASPTPHCPPLRLLSEVFFRRFG